MPKIVEHTWERLKKSFSKVFPDYSELLSEELKDCVSVLDLGCGRKSPLKFSNSAFSLGVDIFKPYISESRNERIHTDYMIANVENLEFIPGSFETVIPVELIEHLTKEGGYALIKKMEKWAKEKIIVTTPSVFSLGVTADGNVFQRHRSYWSLSELKRMGFQVRGTTEWRITYTLFRRMGLRRGKLFDLVQGLSGRITLNHPKHGARFFCVRNKSPKIVQRKTKLYNRERLCLRCYDRKDMCT